MIPRTRSGWTVGIAPVTALFAGTLFLSAALLFFIQPLFTRIVLPHIGGAPAVWTTAMLFFQAALIGGYLYAHLLTRVLGPRAQLATHLALWALALLALPVGMPPDWRFDPAGAAVPQALTLFAAGVGLPFFMLAANAPLIQAWYTRTGASDAHDPYYLYGASNLGSVLALLAFPLVAEPLFGTGAIARGWAAGFLVLGAGLLACGSLARPGRTRHSAGAAADGAPPGFGRVLRWGLTAFVPSSLMLAVTTQISTDVGAIPLIWVVPLALYLLTFVVTFSTAAWLERLPLGSALVIALGLLMAVFGGLLGRSIGGLTLAALLIGFVVVALAAHRALYRSRPDSAHLTLFYVTLSIGGALGGLFNAAVAPVVFTAPWEGPITLALAAAVLVPARLSWPLRRQIALGVAVTGLLFGLLWAADATLAPLLGETGVRVALLATLVAGLLLLRHSGPALAAGAAVLLLAVMLAPRPGVVLQDRSFFGVHTVTDEGGRRVYQNGTTVHGAQRLSDLTAARPAPQVYYHRLGPLGQVFAAAPGRQARTVGVVGLGVGALACYRQPHQRWHFYEIDPLVDTLARDASLFTFVTRCAPDAPTHLGDARVVLSGQAALRFDILVIDAYSSDAVPVHLTTVEALDLYLDRLAPGGLLLFHVSNRYYDIPVALARNAAARGLAARRQSYAGGEDRTTAAEVVMMARRPADFGPLADDPRWRPLPDDGGRPWTDDFANPLAILK